MIYSNVGEIEKKCDKTFVITKTLDCGYAIYGPYKAIMPGEYKVRFYIEILDINAIDTNLDDICCTLDVAFDSGKNIIVNEKFTIREILKNNGTIDLFFKIEKDPKIVEYRLYVTGITGLKTDYERVLITLQEYGIDFSRLFSGNATISDINLLSFVKENYKDILDIKEQGVDLCLDNNAIKACYNDIRFYIKNSEDFQLIREIFLDNEYNFIEKNDSIVIDIGMNIGLATLFFANKKKVHAVYSFEPFEFVYNRALENIELNENLKLKVSTHNLGLSDCNTEKLVAYDTKHTIGTSIRGNNSNSFTKIILRDCVQVLEPIIEKNSNIYDIFIKIDCEGSEFAILKLLDEAGCLKDVRGILMEWHKWWSTELSDIDIIYHLDKNGFYIFNFTSYRNPYAGMIYAINTK